MEFYWPEKNRGNDDLDVSEMFNIVQEKKEDLLRDLTISPQIGKAPADLLTIYAIYEVFSIKGEAREETRAWFLERYKSRLTYYLENKNSLPEYRKFLRNLFNDLLDRILKRKIEEMNLDSYLTDNEEISQIKKIIGGGKEIESWQDFKETLIKRCRKEFPYAEKRLDRVGDSKKIHKEIIDLFTKEKKEQFLEAMSSVMNKDIEVMDESRKRQIIELKNQISDQGKSENLENMLNLLENGDGKIFIEINWMVRILSIFDIDDFEIEKYFLKFYTREIIDRFQKSSSRREPREQNEDHESNSNTNGELVCYMEETPISFGEPIRKISEEKEKIIDSIVQNLGLDENIGKGLKKYLIRLLTNGRDCRVSSLKKTFGIVEIDENVQKLFEKLGISVKYDILPTESQNSNEEDCDVVDANNVNIETENNSIEDDESQKLSEENNSLDLFPDPIAIFDREISRHNYRVSSKKKIDKQIQELCSTDASVKQILCIEMQKNSFGNPKKKKGRSYYTIEVAVTGIRFILFKCNDGKFIIDGVYNHDDYSKRIKEIN